jgi:DNA polymerase elongation subunit (family B)
VRGYENGRAFSSRVKNYGPTLFVAKKEQNSKWKSVDNQHLSPIQFDTINEARDFIESYKDVENFPIYGFSRFAYSYVNEEYPGEIQYDMNHIRLYNIDIETASKNGFGVPETALEEITAITLKKDGKFFVFGCGKYVSPNPNIVYVKCQDEKQMLLSFIDEWSRNGYPDVITGWNIDYYDIPYLIKRISNVLGESHSHRLSPWGYFTSRKVKIMGRENTSMSLAGISSLDYLELYRKFTYKQQDSYRLDNIAFIELGERKLDYSEFVSLQDLYEKDFQKFIEYNIKDVQLVDRLEEKMKLIEMVYILSYYAKVNFSDVFSQVRMWDVIIHNHLWKEKIAIPLDVKSSHKEAAYEGAYVKDPQIGAHENVVSFDLTSLYPHLIMQYNISPDTIVDKHVDITIDELLDKEVDVLKLVDDDDVCLAANGWCFSTKKKGFLPTILEKMYESRNQAKKKMIEAKKNLETLKEEGSSISSHELQAKIQRAKKEVSRYKNLQLALKVQL